MPEGFYARHGKRWVDAAVAGLLLVLLSPLLVVVAVAVRAALGPGVLFRQVRAGRGGLPFTLLKFRSMRAPRYTGEADAARLTRFGRALRACALDEAPQLLNVLRGEMSLVGPRPLPMDYLPRYTPRQAERLRVRPGLAGLAQARGRNAVPWPARLEWDARYAGSVTARVDLMAALGTLRVLLSGRGVNAPGHATMPELPPRDLRRPPGRPSGHPDRPGANRPARRGRVGPA
ncbi:sugar transferase [Pararoseomonas indoligenes]|uniref:Sugar transferase n=1 Tax=Roseomonas indoligenes TaxID=2820811 RepID=A0A940S8C8_9PROT|nr:sugar transferase [Pararoseomonas indoligenes]MBP0493977.1 sugar transferase [Pararoseomonas indoligenes]